MENFENVRRLKILFTRQFFSKKVNQFKQSVRISVTFWYLHINNQQFNILSSLKCGHVSLTEVENSFLVV